MVPEKPEKRIGKQIFYLEEKRKQRKKKFEIDKNLLQLPEDFDELGDEKLKVLKENVEKLENAAKKYEKKIENNKMGIDLADHVNDLIIKSIKTKLEILKN